MNPIHPAQMSPEDRLKEIAEILAAGLMRLRARKSSALSADRGEGFLDLPANQRMHANHVPRGEA